MGINSLRDWVSVKFIGITVSLSVLLFFSFTPSVSALAINDHQINTHNTNLVTDLDISGNVFSWFVGGILSSVFEPIINGINSFFNEIDLFINAQLEVNGCAYFNAPNGGQDTIANCPTPTKADNPQATGFYSAWASIRDIAFGVLVITALIMVISQALSFEIFDAYTIKKVLPRMLVAVIGISLSWQFIQFMAWATNALGNGITSLIATPFKAILASGLSALSSNILTAGLASVGAVAFLVMLILMFVPMFLSLIVMILRQILIVFLAIFAPLAMVCFILPATQNVWKVWWKNFSKALLMFPLIAAALEIGKVFAGTSMAVPNPGLTNILFAMVAYFGPYFFIPMMFKWSGGVLAVAGNMANKAQGSIMKFTRSQTIKQVAKQDKKIMDHSSKYGENAAGNLYRRVRTGSLNPTEQGRKNFEAKDRRLTALSAAQKLKDSGGASTGDDLANELAMEDGMTGRDFISRYSKRLAVEATRDKSTGIANENATASAQDVLAARTALASIQTDYNAPLGSKSMQLAAETARQASVNAFGNNDAGLKQLAEEAAHLIRNGVTTKDATIKSIKSNSARPDQSAPSFGDWSDVLDELVRGNGKATDAMVKKLRVSARKSVGPTELLKGHTNAIKALAPEETSAAQEAFKLGPEGTHEYYQILANLDNIYSGLSAVSQKMADEFLVGVLNNSIDPTGEKSDMTIMQVMDEARAQGKLLAFKPSFSMPTAPDDKQKEK